MQILNCLKITAIACIAFILVGCESKPLTATYLMQNPEVLQEKLANCEQSNSNECQLVRNTAQEFVSMTKDYEENPESFGQKILQGQTDLAKKRLALETAKRAAPTKDTENKISLLQKDYQTQLDQIDALLAVAATSSPE